MPPSEETLDPEQAQRLLFRVLADHVAGGHYSTQHRVAGLFVSVFLSLSSLRRQA